jgi:hypothetical protein
LAKNTLRDPGRLRLLRERIRDDKAIEAMNEAAFGPDRLHKTVYRLREDVKPIKELCFVAIDQKGRMVASIRNWPILINERWPAILLGPLASNGGLTQTVAKELDCRNQHEVSEDAATDHQSRDIRSNDEPNTEQFRGDFRGYRSTSVRCSGRPT